MTLDDWQGDVSEIMHNCDAAGKPEPIVSLHYIYPYLICTYMYCKCKINCVAVLLPYNALKEHDLGPQSAVAVVSEWLITDFIMVKNLSK